MYEMQILNSYDNPVEPKETLGALYGISPPLVNVARKPGEWQVYDIVYTAPRRDDTGKVARPGEITALLNGVLVQHKAHCTESISRWNPLVYQNTAYTDKIRASILKTGCGPIFCKTTTAARCGFATSGSGRWTTRPSYFTSEAT